MRVALALAALVGVAHADAKPDGIADVESREANLESKQPREGVTVSFTLGFDILLGGSLVGSGVSANLRLGHVATRDIVITIELQRDTALHKLAMDTTVSDNNDGLFIGAQLYTTRFFWLRAAAGLDVFTKDANIGGGGGTAHPGAGGLVGGGLDFVRLGYFVLGFEMTGTSSVTSDGFKFGLSWVLGASYY